MKPYLFLAIALALTGAAPATPAASPVVVHIKDFAFVPATVSVAPGVAVQFVNDDQVAHSITASDKSFDSGDFDGGKSWTHVFDKPGTYTYYCDVHTFMKGSVQVSEPKPG